MRSIAYLYWDPRPEVFSFPLPFLGRPILWYGVLFALGFFLGYLILTFLLRQEKEVTLQKNRKIVAEKIMFYVILGAVIGSRLGDMVFYQDWALVKKSPLSFFRVWEGGLASHGGVVGVCVALAIFLFRAKKAYPFLTWRKLLDLVAIPAGVVGGCIRLGNFMNQEILGKKSELPWAVQFGHPFDGSLPSPRHPVQLYESFFYFALAFFLLYVSKKWTRKEGQLGGLCLVLVFVFRFFVEYVKEEQSLWLSSSVFTMGQLLSAPLVVLGCILLFFPAKK